MTAARRELYGSRSCPHTADLREHLEWRRQPFVEYDVETDRAAFQRLQELTQQPPRVPVLVENGLVTVVGWQGRSCAVAAFVNPEDQS
jgi:glutaredoxin 3